MPQSELNRLLILPAIVLAAALSLSGCANLPFFGNDSGSSNNSSSNDDDDDEDEDEDDEDEEEDTDDNSGLGGCPQAFLDATKQEQGSSADLQDVTVNEISPSDFEPASISSSLEGGCILVIEYTQEGKAGIIYEAFVPGSPDLATDIDTALVADGFDNSSENFYIGSDNSFVLVYPGDDSGFTPEMLEEEGLGFLGDDFLVITAYKGEV